MIQNMIDGYLAKNPSKKRSAEEIATLDPKSDVNKLMVTHRSALLLARLKQLMLSGPLDE